MLRREKPDQLHFAIWVGTHLRFEAGQTWRARALWLHWADYAQRQKVKTGTPRSFSHSLRKLGSPALRGLDGRQGKTRFHEGVALDFRTRFDPSSFPETFDEETRRNIRAWVAAYEYRRYVNGEETRDHQRDRISREYEAMFGGED